MCYSVLVMKTLPERKFGSWFITEENAALVICRMVVQPNGKRSKKRLPKAAYTKFTSKEELEQFVARLNNRENRRAIKEIRTRLAFLPTSLMEEFRALLAAEIPNQANAKVLYHNLHRYCLSFFVDKLKLKDPTEWKAAEAKFGMALLDELGPDQQNLRIFNRRMSVRTVVGLVQLLNRFMLFLHRKQPTEIPFIKFQPITGARLRHYRAILNMEKDEPGHYFIPDEHWRLILKELSRDILPWIYLQYHYGLRRSEALGLNLDDIKKGFLSIERQLKSSGETPEYKPLKNRMTRRVPHWFSEPADTYSWLDGATIVHPDTVGIKFAECMDRLKLPYRSHDLRRTFITKALRHYPPVDVQRAAGHSDLRVTMLYMQDDRKLDETVFRKLTN